MKKFFRLMNELAETSTDAGQSASDAYDYSSTSIMGETDENIFKSFGLDSNKYGLDDSKNDSPKAESQGSEEVKGAAQATEESAFLEQINALGATHNDSPVKVESRDEVKNALQMFRDYTQKTQALSDERKGWDSEKSGAQTELNAAIEKFNTDVKSYEGQLQEMQQFTFTLNRLKEEAPDIYDEVQRAYQKTGEQFSNPVLDQQFAAQNKRFEELEKKLTSREDKLIIDSFESEYAALAPLEQSLKELGITMVKDDVRKQWAKNGTGAKNAVSDLYFENMLKAQASKSKVATTQQKTQAKPIGAAGSTRSGSKADGIDSKLTGLKFASALWDKHSKR